jgi:hypothetical protein
MHQLIEKEPCNREVIFPYIGGEEVNTSTTHMHDRYVINFGECSEEVCRQRWPDLMAIVETKVKPGRQSQGSIVNSKHWWMFARPASGLVDSSRGLHRVLVCTIISNKLQFAFLPKGMVYSHKLAVFPFDRFAPFCILQSNIHEIWGRFFSSSMKDDINYSPSD